MTIDDAKIFLEALMTHRSCSNYDGAQFVIESERDIPSVSHHRAIRLKSNISGLEVSNRPHTIDSDILPVEFRFSRYSSVGTWFSKYINYSYSYYYQSGNKLFLFHEGGIRYVSNAHVPEGTGNLANINSSLYEEGISLVNIMYNRENSMAVLIFNPIIFAKEFNSDRLKQVCNKLKNYYKIITENYTSFVRQFNVHLFRAYTVCINDVSPVKIAVNDNYNLNDDELNDRIANLLALNSITYDVREDALDDEGVDEEEEDYEGEEGVAATDAVEETAGSQLHSLAEAIDNTLTATSGIRAQGSTANSVPVHGVDASSVTEAGNADFSVNVADSGVASRLFTSRVNDFLDAIADYRDAMGNSDTVYAVDPSAR